jgi:transposase InsO family protein
MYQDLKQKYWWYGLKRDVSAHVVVCDVSQRVKAEHQRPAGLQHPLKVPKKIVSDRGSQFTSRFWKSFHENMDTKLSFSLTYHPQTDGQTERTNQVLEDMLRACALKHGGSWDKSLPYDEFSYNNSYQASLKMSPFEALYGRKCRTPLYWDQTGERQFFGPEVIQEAEEQVCVIQENLRVAQTR